MSRLRQSALFIALASGSFGANAASIDFSVQNLNLLGNEVLLAIDWIDGDGPSNTIDLFDLQSDGNVALTSLEGGVSVKGAGYELADTSFLSSVILSLTDASVFSLSWTADIQPASSSFADQLAIYLLNPADFYPLVLTSDPVGANGLVNWTAVGSQNGTLSVFAPEDAQGVTWSARLVDETISVPEPSTFALVLMGVMALGIGRGPSARERV